MGGWWMERIGGLSEKGGLIHRVRECGVTYFLTKLHQKYLPVARFGAHTNIVLSPPWARETCRICLTYE